MPIDQWGAELIGIYISIQAKNQPQRVILCKHPTPPKTGSMHIILILKINIVAMWRAALKRGLCFTNLPPIHIIHVYNL